MAIATINPADGDVLATFDPLTGREVDARLAAAASCFRSYRRTSYADRAGWLLAAADLLDAERADAGRLITTEMGKTLRSAEAELAKSAAGLRYYARHAERFLSERPLADPSAVGARRAFTRYDPIGVVLAVMPWNFPVWQVMRFAAPALMAGNVGLLKHAANVPQTALYIEDLFRRAGLPDGCFQTLLLEVPQVEGVLRDPRVAGAAVTGSEAAGQAVASVAGQEIKPTVLELGGSDPYIVMPSADVPRAARVAASARVQNNGQSCIAAKRFIVHASAYDEFEECFVDAMQSLRVGDPLVDGVDVGPLATERVRDEVVALVTDAVEAGATVLSGGRPIEGRGWFYTPTVLTDITPAMRIHTEEAFGPVATLYRVPGIDAAIELANATAFGLGSSVWTNDADEQTQLIAGLEAGAVFINGMTASYPELPFGGIKRSGYGRELSDAGIREFCNLKTVWIG